MKSKKFLSVIMCFALIACMLPYASLSAFADDEIHTSADGDWKYRILDDNTAEIYNNDEPAYLGNEINLVIPQIVDNYTVSALGDFSLNYLQSIETLYIGANIERIGTVVFGGLSALTSFTVADENESYCSEAGVLYDKDMTTLICYPANKPNISFELPQSVTKIEDTAFVFCVNLHNVTFCDSVEHFDIGATAFVACSSLESIVIPEGTNTLESSTFYFCSSLSEIILPNSLVSIKDNVFGECTSLTEITIPSSVSYIDENAFTDSGLTTIKGYWDTEAEHFANNKGYEFISLDILGDIDYDGSVTLADYAVIKTLLTDDTLNFKKVADYNTDGAIDAFDLFYIDLALNQQDA